MSKELDSTGMDDGKGGADPHPLSRNIYRTQRCNRQRAVMHHLTIAIIEGERMARTNGAIGMLHMGSSSRVSLGTTIRTAVDISRWVLVIMTTRADIAARKVILCGIARSLTCGVMAATIEATTSVAHRVPTR